MTGGFSDIDNLTGGTGTDAFTLSGGTLSGAIAGGGGAGVNTLTADNGANTWSVTGADAGSVTGVTGGFSDIDNSYSGRDGLFVEGNIHYLNPQAFPVVLYLRVYAKVIIGIR
ncbi:hypothetical protein C6A37_07075 [Desulfobacteraceae bacterium SEEP-SAG9]|nr:hypothetical protein C6A37_07075 [Desulfobacteraceae bacterium SEEP-SAG9]